MSGTAGNWGSWVNTVCAQLKDEVRAEVEGLRAEVVERGAEVEGLRAEVVERGAEVERLRAVVVELTTEVGGLRSQVGGLRSPQQDVPQPPREPQLSLSLAQRDYLAVALSLSSVPRVFVQQRRWVPCLKCRDPDSALLAYTTPPDTGSLKMKWGVAEHRLHEVYAQQIRIMDNTNGDGLSQSMQDSALFTANGGKLSQKIFQRMQDGGQRFAFGSGLAQNQSLHHHRVAMPSLQLRLRGGNLDEALRQHGRNP